MESSFEETEYHVEKVYKVVYATTSEYFEHQLNELSFQGYDIEPNTFKIQMFDKKPMLVALMAKLQMEETPAPESV